MRKLAQLFIFVFLSIYNAICIVTGGVHLKKLVPSGVINQGILGGFSGKVGPVVGGNWKGIDYMRGYVIPENPNSDAQQVQRGKFAKAVEYAQSLLGSLLQPYWDPFAIKMSGFNSWISENIGLLTSGPKLTNTAIMSKGTLDSTPEFTSSTLAAGDITLVWDDTLVGNALATDEVLVVYFNDNEDLLEVFEVAATRTDGTCVISPVSTANEDDFTWLIFYRGTGETFMVSDSVQRDVTI